MKKTIKKTKPAKLDLNRSRAEQSLENSELRYRRVFETAQDGILILDAKTGAITDVNPYLIAMLGYSREEFIEKKLWQVGAFKDIEASKDAFEALRRNEYIRYENLPLKAKGGRLIQVEFVSNVYLVGDDKVIQCNIRDITEHRRLVAALQENERKYRTLVTQSPDGVFLVDLSGNFSQVNKEMCDGLGFSEAELRSMNIWDIVPEQYLDQYRKRLTKILSGESLTEPSEYTVRGKDGKILFIEVLSAPYYSEKGIISFQGIARDITARKQAEQALRENGQRFQSLIENASDLVLILNPDYTIAYASPSVERILGHTVAAVVGARITDFIDPQDLPDLIAATEHRARTPGLSPFSMLVRVRHADGSWRILEGMGNNLLDQPGVSGLVINARDITERKRAEESLRKEKMLSDSIIDNMPAGIAFLDNDFVLRKCNRAYEALIRTYTPYSPEQALGMSYFDYVPGSREQVEEWFTTVRDSGQSETRYGFKLVIKRDGEETTYWDTSIAPVFGSAGTVEGILILTQDVTERKRAEEALRKKDEHHRNVVESIFRFVPEGLLVFTENLSLVKQNKAFEEITQQYAARLGYTEQELADLIAEQVRSRLLSGDTTEIHIPKKRC